MPEATRPNPRQPIPTHLVLGFLGVGKTTAILNLLKQKPPHETWAVLVNEFGEVGIDGALMADQGAFIREVPGGCMCCTAGLPMQIGLNMLIARARPDRLLVEPTGLGHPTQIIATLTGEYYSETLTLAASVCLVDPRRLEEKRVLENAQFHDQVAVADVLVANKTDLCSPEQVAAFHRWANGLEPRKRRIETTCRGQIDLNWLAGDFANNPARHPDSHRHHHSQPAIAREHPPVTEKPWQCVTNQGDGYQSVGWRIHPDQVLDAESLFRLAHDDRFDRIKGIVHTTSGWMALNAVEGAVTLLDSPPLDTSRLEIIGRSLDAASLDQQLASMRAS